MIGCSLARHWRGRALSVHVTHNFDASLFSGVRGWPFPLVTDKWHIGPWTQTTIDISRQDVPFCSGHDLR
eukprot:951873-Pyramimonas_sp.AAC.1